MTNKPIQSRLLKRRDRVPYSANWNQSQPLTVMLEPYSIVGGNPAREIRKRFSEDKIKKLLELKWWDWEIDKITRNVSNLTGENIELIID